MTLEQYVTIKHMGGALAKNRDLNSKVARVASVTIDAYFKGRQFGQNLVQHAACLANDPKDDLRSQIAALRSFRVKLTDEQWNAWTGREFAFGTKGLRCALSVVLVVFPSLLRFLKVRSYSSAEATCSVVWGRWLSPGAPRRRRVPSELSELKNPNFVRGFVDGVAGPHTAESP
jgi:hypothetical protein